MIERTIAWPTRGNRRLRYRGAIKNDHWLHHRAAALNPTTTNPPRPPRAAIPFVAAQRSNPVLSKASRKRTADHYPGHSFTSLLADLATICANQFSRPRHAAFT